MEANIARIASVCRQHGVHWRPHIKGQKTIGIIRKELAAGAIGVTCAKLGEAEVMAAAGIRNILIANQIVGPIKLRRLVDLLELADPIVAVDSLANLDELAEAARGRGRILPVVIEVDIGMKRAGVAAGDAGRGAGKGDRASVPGLRFRGLDRLGEPGRDHRRSGQEGAGRGGGDRPADGERRCLPRGQATPSRSWAAAAPAPSPIARGSRA